jgi:hypothetical protein
MRVNTDFGEGVMRSRLRLDAGESLDAVGQQGMDIRLTVDGFKVDLDESADPHPDLVALAILTVVRPWVGTKLVVDFPVSLALADAVRGGFGFALQSTSGTVRQREQGGGLGLLYSGGPDCMAAEVMLGEEMPLFHFRRVRHRSIPDRTTHVRYDVQERLVRVAEDRGRTVSVARSDLEFLCQPFPTFPTWPAVGVGAYLLADTYDLGGIVAGSVLNGAYVRWGTDLGPGQSFAPDVGEDRIWRDQIRTCGLDLVQPAAGSAAVQTAAISATHPLYDIARSCLLGTYDSPCFQCTKCLGKEVLKAHTADQPIPSPVQDLANDSEIVNQSLSTAATSRAMYSYLLKTFGTLKGTSVEHWLDDRGALDTNVDWVARYYRPALEDWVPGEYRQHVEAVIGRNGGFMSTELEAALAEL